MNPQHFLHISNKVKVWYSLLTCHPLTPHSTMVTIGLTRPIKRKQTTINHLHKFLNTPVLIKNKLHFINKTTYFTTPTTYLGTPTTYLDTPTTYLSTPTTYLRIHTTYLRIQTTYFITPTTYDQ